MEEDDDDKRHTEKNSDNDDMTNGENDGTNEDDGGEDSKAKEKKSDEGSSFSDGETQEQETGAEGSTGTKQARDDNTTGTETGSTTGANRPVAKDIQDGERKENDKKHEQSSKATAAQGTQKEEKEEQQQQQQQNGDGEMDNAGPGGSAEEEIQEEVTKSTTTPSFDDEEEMSPHLSEPRVELDPNMKELAWWVAHHSDSHGNIDWSAVQREASIEVQGLMEQSRIWSIPTLMSSDDIEEEFERFLEKMKRALSKGSIPKSIKMLLASRGRSIPNTIQRHRMLVPATVATTPVATPRPAPVAASAYERSMYSTVSGKTAQVLQDAEILELAELYVRSKRKPGRSIWKWDFVMQSASEGLRCAIAFARTRKGFMQSPLHSLIRSKQKDEFHRRVRQLEEGAEYVYSKTTATTTSDSNNNNNGDNSAKHYASDHPNSSTLGQNSNLPPPPTQQSGHSQPSLLFLQGLRRRRLDDLRHELTIKNKEDTSPHLTDVEMELAWLREESRYSNLVANVHPASQVNWEFIIKHATGDLGTIVQSESKKSSWHGGNRVHKIVRKSMLEVFQEKSIEISKRLEEGYRREKMAPLMHASIECNHNGESGRGLVQRENKTHENSTRTSTSGSSNSSSEMLTKPRRVEYKPIYGVGHRVYVNVSEVSGKEEAWSMATILEVRVSVRYEKTDGVKYLVRMEDERRTVIDELDVKNIEDYIWCIEHNVAEDLKGVARFVDPDSDDPFVRTRGWYTTDVTGDVCFVSLYEAMCAYDHHVVKSKEEKTEPSDLNLPQQWRFVPSQMPQRTSDGIESLLETTNGRARGTVAVANPNTGEDLGLKRRREDDGGDGDDSKDMVGAQRQKIERCVEWDVCTDMMNDNESNRKESRSTSQHHNSFHETNGTGRTSATCWTAQRQSRQQQQQRELPRYFQRFGAPSASHDPYLSLNDNQHLQQQYHRNTTNTNPSVLVQSHTEDEYRRLLQWFSKKQNLRWSSFEAFLQSEWSGLKQHGTDHIPQTQWDQFLWDQRRSWKDFCQEEMSAFRNHAEECEALVTSSAACGTTESSTIQFLRQRFLALRQERLEDMLRRFQQVSDRFHVQSQQEQWNSNGWLMEDIKYRWHSFQTAELCLLEDHLRECADVLGDS